MKLVDKTVFVFIPACVGQVWCSVHSSFIIPLTYKDLFYFTGQCLSLDEHPQFRETIIEQFADARNIQNSTFKIQNFVQLCSDHLIITTIYLKFKKHRILELLPDELAPTLQSLYELNRERNEQILQQIDEITKILNKANIQPVFLKGTANLLDGLYSDVGERMIGDIDFLVREEDYLKAAELVQGIGYRHDEKISYVDFTSRKHYARLHKEDEQAAVEIHRILVSDRYSKSINPLEVFRDKKPVSGKTGIYVPSDAHKLVHTFAHDQLEDSGYAYKRTGFRGTYDLYLLAKRTNVTALNKQTRYRKQANAWLVFSQRVLGLNSLFLKPESLSAKWFCLKYNFSMSFIGTYSAWIFFKKLVYLIVHRYIFEFLKAIFLKKERQAMYRRLTHADWYKEHRAHYKRYF